MARRRNQQDQQNLATADDFARTARKLLASCPGAVQGRGRAYFREGRVEDLRQGGAIWFAMVRGVAQYHAWIDIAHARWHCSCPAAKPCKHLVAVLCEIQGAPTGLTPRAEADRADAASVETEADDPLQRASLAIRIDRGGRSARLGMRFKDADRFHQTAHAYELRGILFHLFADEEHREFIRSFLYASGRMHPRAVAELLARCARLPEERRNQVFVFLPDGRRADFQGEARPRLRLHPAPTAAGDAPRFRLERLGPDDTPLPVELREDAFFWPDIPLDEEFSDPAMPIEELDPATQEMAPLYIQADDPDLERIIRVFHYENEGGDDERILNATVLLENLQRLRRAGVEGLEALPPLFSHGPEYCLRLRAEEDEAGDLALAGRLEMVYGASRRDVQPLKDQARKQAAKRNTRASKSQSASQNKRKRLADAMQDATPAAIIAALQDRTAAEDEDLDDEDEEFLRALAAYDFRASEEESAPALAGFPPLSRPPARLSRSRMEWHAETGCVVKRSPRKEAQLAARRPGFSFRAKTGEFRVAPRRLGQFFTRTLPGLLREGVLLRIDARLLPLFRDPPRAFLTLRSESSGIDWFSGRIDVEGVEPEDRLAMFAAWKAGRSFVRLSRGGWVRAKGGSFQKLMEAAAASGLQANAQGELKQISRGQALAVEMEAETRGDASVARLRRSLMRSAPGSDSKAGEKAASRVPAEFKGKLRPYQREGFAFFQRLFGLGVGGVLADDMGLGKTIQSIAFLCAVYNQKKSARTLIVGPLASLSVWDRELERFAPHLRKRIWHGGGRGDSALPARGIILTTYGVLTRDEERFGEAAFDVAFVDEAQNARNPQTRTARALRRLHAKAIFCLTGTPLENRLEDFWSVMDLSFPGLLGGLKSFRNQFSADQPASMQRLRARTAPFVLRRTKAMALPDLPPRQEIDAPAPMLRRQAALYEQARREAVAELKRAGSDYLARMLPHLTRLRRIACHPDLGMDSANPRESGKLERFAELMDQCAESGAAALVFSQFTDVLAVAGRLLEEQGVSFLYLDGKTSARKRAQRVEAFQAGEGQAFLISLKAGGTALTLTRAETVIHLDPWWNPAVERQASDRAHRMGQTKPVFVYRLFSENTVEARVRELQAQKQALFDALFGESTQSASVSREDLLAILQ